MSTSPGQQSTQLRAEHSIWREFLIKEDWWSIWIGLGLLLVATVFFLSGSSLSWIAVTPAKWHTADELTGQFLKNYDRYIAQFVMWVALFGVSTHFLKIPFKRFLTSFVFIYVVSILVFALGQWDQADFYNLEPPLVALALGLLLANTVGIPECLEAGFRVEFYIKIGIVLLGATLPFTLIVWAGPIAIVQASIVSLTTFFVIYFVAVYFGLDRRLAATLGAGGAVCGVSGSIAIAGAVGAKKEHAPISISIVIFWAIVMIFGLPLVCRYLQLPTGVAGAWIGTSEFADAAGFAAAQTYAAYAGQVPGIEGSADAAVTAFTLMKVIGRDVWIGIWALVLSIVATTRWESTGVNGRASYGEIWRRFPKFVIGFLLASLAVTAISRGFSFAQYKASVVPNLVGPIKNFRTWAFIFCFFSIGLTTRVRDFVKAGPKPFYAFTAGVVVNVILGFVLSTQVFVDFWVKLGQQ
jgi:uncharacterized integral membrane protein (TIGR00698 family)